MGAYYLLGKPMPSFFFNFFFFESFFEFVMISLLFYVLVFWP